MMFDLYTPQVWVVTQQCGAGHAALRGEGGCVMHTQYILHTPVPVMTSSDPDIFPLSWRGEPINAWARALEGGDACARAEKIFAQAFDKYAAVQTLPRDLGAVYVLQELRYRGIAASGTNSLKNVYLKQGDRAAGFTDAWVELTFHCEFSSILLRVYADAFDVAAWDAVNPVGFVYFGSGVDAINAGMGSKTFDSAMYADGFLYPYATSTRENDFNAFAGCLFMGGSEFFDAYSSAEKIRRKAGMVLDFYARIGYAIASPVRPAPPTNVIIKSAT